MKRCPQCGRDYNDDSLKFCLDDGTELLFGPALSERGAVPGPREGSPSGVQVATGDVSSDEQATAILHGVPSSGGTSGDAATRPFINTNAAEPHEGVVEPTEKQSFSAHRVAEPKKTLDKRLLLAPIVLSVIVLAGFAGYRYLNSSGGQINSIAVLPFENRSGSEVD